MTTEETLALLRARVAMLVERPEAEISDDTPLHELGLDSMGFVDLLVFIEKQFGLSLANSMLGQEDFSTLGALARRITGA